MKPRIKVLCVDDNQPVLSITKELLEWKGYEVAAATSGQAAVDQVCRHFDLVILDYNLPDFNGDVVAERWKREQPLVPILMMSGCVNLPDHALDNVDGHLAKGGRTDVFFGVISELTKARTDMCA